MLVPSVKDLCNDTLTSIRANTEIYAPASTDGDPATLSTFLMGHRRLSNSLVAGNNSYIFRPVLFEIGPDDSSPPALHLAAHKAH